MAGAPDPSRAGPHYRLARPPAALQNGGMESPDGTNHVLLTRWQSGDHKALEELVERHLPWIRERVHRRLGSALREKLESGDIVQDSLIQVMHYGPRFVTQTEAQFRALLGLIIENVLRDKLDFFNAECRTPAREQPLPSDSFLPFDPPLDSITTPSAQIERQEELTWLRVGLQVLDAGERRIIIAREWDRLPFREIGAQLGISESAAKMRHQRAMAQLTTIVGALRKGDVDRALDGHG